jgi:hypothetical protein
MLDSNCFVLVRERASRLDGGIRFFLLLHNRVVCHAILNSEVWSPPYGCSIWKIWFSKDAPHISKRDWSTSTRCSSPKSHPFQK